MATLTVSATQDFSGDSLSNIDIIDFTNPVATTATATFANTQFNNVAILDNVAFDGAFATTNVVVNGGSVNAFFWTFSTWTATDSITLNGSGGADTILGTLQSDTITGGLGADNLDGGNSNDTFVYNSNAELVGGESINGGGGTADTLRLAVAGTYNFLLLATALSGVERLEFAASSDGSAAVFASSQIGGAGITSIVGSSQTETLAIDGGSVDASLLTFVSWSESDTINLVGGAGDDTIVGTAFGDRFQGESGGDTLNGGDGDDLFSYNNASDVTASEVIIGGMERQTRSNLAPSATFSSPPRRSAVSKYSTSRTPRPPRPPISPVRKSARGPSPRSMGPIAAASTMRSSSRARRSTSRASLSSATVGPAAPTPSPSMATTRPTAR